MVRYEGNPFSIAMQILRNDVENVAQAVPVSSEFITDAANVAEIIGDLSGYRVRPFTGTVKKMARLRQVQKKYNKKRAKSSRRARTKSKPKKRSKATLVTGSNSVGNKSLKRRTKKRKKMSASMQARVAKLEKMLKSLEPSRSKASRAFYTPFYKAVTTVNTKTVSQFDIITKDAYNQVIFDVTGGNPTVNEKTRINYVKFGSQIKNVTLQNIRVKAKYYICVDSCDDSCLTLLRNRIIDRFGLSTGVGTIQSATPASSGVTSYQPEYFSLQDNRMFTDVIGIGGVSQYWKGIGKAYDIYLQPGDTLNMSGSIPAFTFDEEDYTDATETYLKKMNIQLIVQTFGELGYSGTITGFSDHILVGYNWADIQADYVDGLGRNLIDENASFDNTGVTTISAPKKPEPVLITQ